MLLPNHTQVPNEFMEKYMQGLSGSAVKVFLTICRKTIGWHKVSDAISISQIQAITGIKSRSTISDAIIELSGLVTPTKVKGRTTVYDIKYGIPEAKVKPQLVRQTASEMLSPKDPRIAMLITHFFDAYQERCQKKPVVHGTIWGSNFKTLLNANSEGEIKKVIDFFFAWQDRSDFSFGTFYRRYDAIAPKALKTVFKAPERASHCPVCGNASERTGALCPKCEAMRRDGKRA